MNWLVPLPVALPLLVAAGLVGAAPVCHRRIADSAAILTALLAAAACCLLAHLASKGTIVYWFGGWGPRGSAAIGISFVIGPLGAGLAAFCSCLMTVALVFTWQYFDAVRTYFHALMLVFLAAMNGFCLTGDLFNLFVFFELMSVAAYALTGYKVEEVPALAGAINFAVTNSVGAFLVLIGIGLVYGRTGALNMAQAGLALARHPADALAVAALAFIACGFLIKAAVAPFHFWLGDAHAVAPTPVCVLFSGVMIELGLYGAFKVYWTVFHPVLQSAEPRIRLVFLALGALTALLGGVMCFAQRHLKRLLAFSSISHIGMMLVGVSCLSVTGTAGAGLYLIGHGLVKGALFLSCGILLHRLGTVDQIELFGRGRGMVFLGIAFAASGLGLAGFPPFGTYLGKQMMEEATKAIGQHWPEWLFVLCSALTGGAVLRAAAMVFLGWGDEGAESRSAPTDREQRETRKSHDRVPIVMLSAAVLLAVAPLASAAIGGRFATRIESAAARFIDFSLYAQTVLGGASSGPLKPAESIRATHNGLISGFAAAGGACAAALLGLFGARLCDRIPKSAVAFLSAPLRFLRRIHSGHIGDLIVWLTMGLVTIGIGLAIAVRAL